MIIWRYRSSVNMLLVYPVRAHQQHTVPLEYLRMLTFVRQKKPSAKSHTERNTWWVRCITDAECIDIYKWLEESLQSFCTWTEWARAERVGRGVEAEYPVCEFLMWDLCHTGGSWSIGLVLVCCVSVYQQVKIRDAVVNASVKLPGKENDDANLKMKF